MNLKEYSKLQKPFLIAHGGYSSKHPENTLISYVSAIPFKPDAVEMDVVLDPTSDELICHHPKTPSNEKGQFTEDLIRESLNEEGQILF